MEDVHLKYPIGVFHKQDNYSQGARNDLITSISSLHEKIHQVVADWSPGQFELSYRPGGWSGRQVIHHLSDSHLMALVRIKLTLTEDNPVVKPYLEAEWATLPDYDLDARKALEFLAVIQLKMAHLFRTLNSAQWQRTFFHPETQKTFDVVHLLTLYEWHGRHHLGHLKIIDGL